MTNGQRNRNRHSSKSGFIARRFQSEALSDGGRNTTARSTAAKRFNTTDPDARRLNTTSIGEETSRGSGAKNAAAAHDDALKAPPPVLGSGGGNDDAAALTTAGQKRKPFRARGSRGRGGRKKKTQQQQIASLSSSFGEGGDARENDEGKEIRRLNAAATATPVKDDERTTPGVADVAGGLSSKCPTPLRHSDFTRGSFTPRKTPQSKRKDPSFLPQGLNSPQPQIVIRNISNESNESELSGESESAAAPGEPRSMSSSSATAALATDAVPGLVPSSSFSSDSQQSGCYGASSSSLSQATAGTSLASPPRSHRKSAKSSSEYGASHESHHHPVVANAGGGGGGGGYQILPPHLPPVHGSQNDAPSCDFYGRNNVNVHRHGHHHSGASLAPPPVPPHLQHLRQAGPPRNVFHPSNNTGAPPNGAAFSADRQHMNHHRAHLMNANGPNMNAGGFDASSMAAAPPPPPPLGVTDRGGQVLPPMPPPEFAYAFSGYPETMMGGGGGGGGQGMPLPPYNVRKDSDSSSVSFETALEGYHPRGAPDDACSAAAMMMPPPPPRGVVVDRRQQPPPPPPPPSFRRVRFATAPEPLTIPEGGGLSDADARRIEKQRGSMKPEGGSLFNTSPRSFLFGAAARERFSTI